MSLVRIQRKGQMTLPAGVRSAVGLADGDIVNVKVSGRRIIVTPTLVIDRSKFRTADDEYTPSQRRAIIARLKEAEKGPFYGPFKSGTEIVAFLKTRQRTTKSAKSRKSR